MPRSEDFWDTLYQVFEPREILVGERGDSLYCSREHSPYDDMKIIFRKTSNRSKPPIAFFAGHRGSGKSSLLFRLMEHCHNHFFVVYFDIQHNLDKDKANHIDLLYLLGAAIYAEGINQKAKLDESNLRELHKSVYSIAYTEEEKTKDESLNVAELIKGLFVFGAGTLGSAAGAKLAEAVLKPFTITSGVTEKLLRERKVEREVQNVINNVNLIINDVQAQTGKQVFVIVDGLDKIEYLDQAKLIFLQSRALLGPFCHIIYTVPMLIQTMPEFFSATQDCESFLLPNVKVFNKINDTSRHQPGYDTMHEVAQRRLTLAQLQQEDIFEAEVLDYLIAKSGGVMRWFIGMVRDSCRSADSMGLDKVNMRAAQKAVENRVADLTGKLTIEQRKELRRVREEKLPSSSEESHKLLHALFIVAYRNGSTWYDTHPLLWDEL